MSSSPFVTDADRNRRDLRNVIVMAIPVMLTTSSRAMMDIADYIMITWLPTDDAQAAILSAQTLMWSYIVIGLGIVSMINTFASQALGRKQPHECSAYGWQSLYIGIGLGAIGLALIPMMPYLVTLIGHEERVQAAELSYLKIVLLGIGPTIIAEGLGWYFVGIHRPWVAVWTSLEANVVNIAVCYVLMFGKLGFEPMGIAGAATGTVVAVSYRTVRLSIAMLLPSQAETYNSRRTWRPSLTRIIALLRVGIPAGMQWFTEVVVWAIFVNVLVGKKFGTAHLIATSIAWQYMRIAFMPTIGVGRALSALVGKAIGENDPDRAVRQARIVVTITAIYMISLALIYCVFGWKLVGWFNDSAEVVAIGSKVMVCLAAFQLFDALGITYGAALRGAGDTFIPSLFFIVSHWVIIVGGGWWIAETFPQWGSIGPWIAGATLIAVTSVFLWWRWAGGAWRKIDLFQKSTVVELPSA
jgi:MATE family multidrug resistance protein